MSTAVHTHSQRQAIVNRLSRIEGHVRKIKSMVEEGRDCPDLLIQLAAVRSAISKAGQAVLEDHIESCLLTPGSQEETDAAWAELRKAFDAFF